MSHDPPNPGPDYKNLHAPWRRSYMDMLTAQSRPASPQARDAAPYPASSNFIRDYWLNPVADERNHVIVRTGTEVQGSGGIVLLNKYPYANGHLLVALGLPRLRLLDYSEAQRAELWSLTDLAVLLCERTLEPQGINVGLNQGAAAGAGVPEHVHVHVVPRWHGDVNFMTVAANIRVIPSALDDMARRYRDTWAALKP